LNLFSVIEKEKLEENQKVKFTCLTVLVIWAQYHS